MQCPCLPENSQLWYTFTPLFMLPLISSAPGLVHASPVSEPSPIPYGTCKGNPGHSRVTRSPMVIRTSPVESHMGPVRARYLGGIPHIPCYRTCTSHIPGSVHPRYPSHPLLLDLYTAAALCIPCSRTCTAKAPLTPLAPGPVHPRYPSHLLLQPVHPRYPSHPLLQDLYTAAAPHIPCSRACTSQVCFDAAEPVHTPRTRT